MRIRTDIRAGDMSLAQCQKERDYWKAQATKMEEIAKSPSPQPPAPSPSPVTTGSGCGWINGVYYKDQSGICG